MAPTGHRVNGLAVAKARLAIRDGVSRKPMTQAAFANRLGIHVVTMSNIENGKANVSLDLLERIARASGRPRDEFLADPVDEEDRAVPPLSRDEFALLGDLMGRLGTSLAADQPRKVSA